MPDPLLNYAVSTSPIPLQVSANGAITIVANNPGIYSDQPGTDYVTVTKIVFDFGEVGADGSDLTTEDGSSWDVVGPSGWDAPTVEGVRFTFTPPAQAVNVFPNVGLTFVFQGIAINAKVGSVLLTISETASAPGDPADPNDYPPIPEQVGVYTTLIGKFPVDFSLSPLIANPPNVNAGQSTTISWAGTVGAVYSLSFGRQTVTAHQTGTLLGASDHYPNSAQGDAPLALNAATTFTLTVQYTPPGGSDTAVLQSQVTVGVNYPNPSVVSFTVSPDFLPGLGSGPGTVLLTWQTANGQGLSPVSFSVDPPLSDQEVTLNLNNDLFNTSHLASAQAGFTFTQGHRITIQVVGPPGTTAATQTARLLGCTQLNYVIDLPQAPSGIAFTPDGKHMIVPGAAAGSGWSVFEVSGDEPATWPVSYLNGEFSYSGVVTTPDGKYVLSTCAMAGFPTGTAATIAIEVVAGQPGANWPKTVVPLPLPSQFTSGGDLSISPNGKYIFAQVPQGAAVITIPSGAAPASWTATLMSVTGEAAFTPDGKYVIVASGAQTNVLAIDPAVTPDQWVSTVVAQPADDVVVTPDGTYAILVHASTSSVSAITIADGTSPAGWTVTPVTLAIDAPAQISLSPDGTLAFVTPASFTTGPVAMLELAGAPSAWTGTVFGQVQAAFPFCAVSPDGQYLLITNADGLVAFRLTPPLATTTTAATRSFGAAWLRLPAARNTAPTLDVGDDRAAPLLDYAVATTPLPLQISAPGIITIIASNPGTYSDQPAQNYVALTSLVLDFGVKGSGADNLTAVDGSALIVTPPSGWAAPIVVGLQFTFTPPVAGGNIFPAEGLAFVVANIPVNAVVGTVTLTITEVASSPGNPTEPDVYPPQPKQARGQTKGIGKFPADFTVGDLVAQPTIVPVGGGPVLSWSGTAGATYALAFGTTKVTRHANQTPLQATDLYPNSATGDSLLSLPATTVFTLAVTYTPSGGSTPAVIQRQVSVDVNYPGPGIAAFTISPPWIPLSQTTPTPVTIAWQALQGGGASPVDFTLDPPLSVAELAANAGNNFFNTSHTLGGQGTFNFLQGHRLTMTVLGKPGTTSAVQTINLYSYQKLSPFTSGIKYPTALTFTPDARYGIMCHLLSSDRTLNVIDFSGGDPSKWTAAGIVLTTNASSAVATSDGSLIIAASATTVYAITIDRTKPANEWTVVTVPLNTPSILTDVAVSPSGRYLYIGAFSGLFVVDIGPGLPPANWGAPVSIATGFVDQLLATPDGRYLLAARAGSDNRGQGGNLMIVQIAEGTPPDTWKISSLPVAHEDGLPTGTSSDGRYLFVARTGSGAIDVIDTTASADAAQWKLATVSKGTGDGQQAVAVGTPDNQFVFYGRSASGAGAKATYGIVQITPGASPKNWPSLVLGHGDNERVDIYLAGVTPDGRYLLPQTDANAITPLAVTPTLAAAPPAPSRFGPDCAPLTT